jgi:hypothetical protein
VDEEFAGTCKSASLPNVHEPENLRGIETSDLEACPDSANFASYPEIVSNATSASQRETER